MTNDANSEWVNIRVHLPKIIGIIKDYPHEAINILLILTIWNGLYSI